MSAPAKITAFVAMLVVVFATSLWVGNAVGPNPDVAVPHPTEVHPHEGDGQ